MKPEKSDIAFAQALLGIAGSWQDGVFGKESQRIAREAIPWTFKGTPTAPRWVAAVIQTEAKKRKVDAGALDAYWGPQTAVAAQLMRGITIPRPDEKPIPGVTPRCWYPTDSQMTAHYGPVGQDQVQIALPYPMVLDWDLSTTVNKLTCHKKVADSLQSVFEGILSVYGLASIRALKIDRFGGCLNVRKKRGGSTWSTHAWGVAVDLYPTGNQLQWNRNRAVFAKREYDELRNVWRRHGWMSLGECADFDWMHWQKNP
jgi:hypothetical protein